MIEAENSNYYQENLEFWETAWSRVSKPHKELANLDYILEIPAAFKKYDCKHILDIACGSGWLAIYLQREGFQCTGIDVSESAIKLAKGWLAEESIPNVEFFVQDMMNLDFPDNSFDGILINAVFEHLDYQRGKEFLQKIKRVLKPDALMFGVYDKVAVGNKGEFRTLEDGARVYTDNIRKGMLMRYFNDEELNTLLRETAWQVESIRKNDMESRVVMALNKK